MVKVIKEKQPTASKLLVVRSLFVRMPPDKIRLVAKSLVNKQIETALAILEFIPKAARQPLILIVKEAISQAKNKNLNLDNLVVKNIVVNEGPKLKRRRIIHRGRATSILKRMSHITITLSSDGNPKLEARNSKQIQDDKNLKAKK